jgi:hypothetical protein
MDRGRNPHQVAFPRSLQFVSQIIATICLLIASRGFGEEAASAVAQRPFDTLDELISTMDREWPVGVTRDSKDAVTSVILPVRYSFDENLKLLATSSTLKELSLSYNRSLRQPSASGIASLHVAPSLRSVTLQCISEPPEDLFAGLGMLDRLEKLTLLAATPSQPRTYLHLTNLVHLRQLTIRLPTRFTREDAAILAQLSSLKNIHLVLRHLSEADCHPLMIHSGITNLLVESAANPKWRMQFVNRPN